MFLLLPLSLSFFLSLFSRYVPKKLSAQKKEGKQLHLFFSPFVHSLQVVDIMCAGPPSWQPVAGLFRIEGKKDSPRIKYLLLSSLRHACVCSEKEEEDMEFIDSKNSRARRFELLM